MINSISMVNNDSDFLDAHLPNSCYSCKPDEIKQIFHSRNSDTFNLLLQNIRSFNKNFDDLSVYLDNYMKNIDIIAFLLCSKRLITQNRVQIEVLVFTKCAVMNIHQRVIY